MAPNMWTSSMLLTLTSLQLVSPQKFVSDNLLTSDGQSPCRSRSGGYYADLASDCSSYTLCGPGGREFDFSCPPGTRFHQQFLVCDHEYRVDCPDSPRFYELNELIGKTGPSSGSAGQQKQTASSRPAQVETSSARSAQIQTSSARSAQIQTASARSAQIQISSARSAQIQTASARPAKIQTAFRRPRIDPRPQLQRSFVSAFNASASRRAPLQLQPQRPAAPRPAAPALPAADVGQTLLELVQIASRESSRRPPTTVSQQRPRPADIEPRSRQRQVSPAVPAILRQVAALGGLGLTQVAPPRRPGLTQEAPQHRPAPRQLQQQSTIRGTFFPARPGRPQQELQSGVNRLQRLNKSLSNPRAGGEAAVRFPPQTSLRASPGRQGTVRSVAGGWRPASRRAAGADPRCPRCLAALVTEWDNCFPCVSVLR